MEERITQFLAADKSLSPSGTFLNKSADLEEKCSRLTWRLQICTPRWPPWKVQRCWRREWSRREGWPSWLCNPVWASTGWSCLRRKQNGAIIFHPRHSLSNRCSLRLSRRNQDQRRPWWVESKGQQKEEGNEESRESRFSSPKSERYLPHLDWTQISSIYFAPEVNQKSIQRRWVRAPQSWQAMFELVIWRGSSVRSSQQSWAKRSQMFRSLCTERRWPLQISCHAACPFDNVLLQWIIPSEIRRQKTDTERQTWGVGNWYKHNVLKEYMDGIRKAKPLTEYQWWALRAIQSTVLSNPWRGWSLWGGNSRTPDKTAKTVGNSLTPSSRWCWARSSVDTRQKTKCARPSPKNHSLHFADGKAGERQ